MSDGPGATDYVMINGFLIDCALKENHTFDSDVTEYPVESGGKITDNILPRPITVEIEGLVTNTPLGPIATTRETQGATLNLTSTSPADMMYEFFMRLRDDRKTFPIQTSLRTYNNMALKGLNIPRGDHMNDIKFTATFQQIQSIENKRTIRVSTPIGKGGGGGGKTVTKAATAWPGRTILIDKRLRAWFDPDVETGVRNIDGVEYRSEVVGGWRHYAEFSDKRLQPNGRYTYGNQKKWFLSRNGLLPTTASGIAFINSGSSSLVAPSTQAELEDEADSRFKQIVAVTESQCILQGFTIKTPPGGNKPPRSTIRPR